MKQRVHLRTTNGRLLVILAFGILLTVWPFAVSAEVRLLLAPVAACVFCVIAMWVILAKRRKELPLLDPGMLTVLAICVYAIVPSLQFLLAGMQHTLMSAYPLYVLDPSPRDMGSLTWWYTVYLAVFGGCYLFVDRGNQVSAPRPNLPSARTVRVLFYIFLAMAIFVYAMDNVYGIDQYGVYDIERLTSSNERLAEMPLFFRQVYGIVGHIGMFFIVKLALLLAIFLNWSKARYRYFLYVGLAITLLQNILWMGARTDFVVTVLACVLLYHQFVKKLSLVRVASIGAVMFGLFLTIGILRGGNALNANLERSADLFQRPDLVFSTNTEFQALFGGNYDLREMKREGALDDIPMQLRFYDVVMLIPQQLLSFEKIKVDVWYSQLSRNPGYFMFDPISQAIVGWGMVELVLRAMALGFVFAKLRTWYLRRATHFWATVFFAYVTVITYYTIRGTAFYLLSAVVLFRFLPLYAFVRLLVGTDQYFIPSAAELSPLHLSLPRASKVPSLER